MVSIAEPSVVSINEPLNLLTMKKITKTKVSNVSITSNVSIASRQFSVIPHSSLIIRRCFSVIRHPRFIQLSCFSLVFHGWQASPTARERRVKNTRLKQTVGVTTLVSGSSLRAGLSPHLPKFPLQTGGGEGRKVFGGELKSRRLRN